MFLVDGHYVRLVQSASRTGGEAVVMGVGFHDLSHAAVVVDKGSWPWFRAVVTRIGVGIIVVIVFGITLSYLLSYLALLWPNAAYAFPSFVFCSVGLIWRGISHSIPFSETSRPAIVLRFVESQDMVTFSLSLALCTMAYGVLGC